MKVNLLTSRKRKIIAASAISLIAVLGFSAFVSGIVVRAYGGGQANWQIGLAETTVAPGTQLGFGIWGWCEFSGAANPANPMSGTSGDCQVSGYIHGPASLGGNLNCQISVDVTSWFEAPGFIGAHIGVPNDLIFFGVQTPAPGSNPTCVTEVFGGAGPAGPVDLAPAQTGHYNANAVVAFMGLTGEIQLQVTQTSK
jgi:hypothetical protein